MFGEVTAHTSRLAIRRDPRVEEKCPTEFHLSRIDIARRLQGAKQSLRLREEFLIGLLLSCDIFRCHGGRQAQHAREESNQCMTESEFHRATGR
jgi:hypothetical protein